MAQQDVVLSPETAADYSHELISSRRVEGTPVYDRAGEKLGTIRSMMIGKLSGKVAYAVLSTSGFLHLRENVYPIPWELLTYDIDRDGYVLDMDRGQLEEAPTMTLDDTDRPIDKAYQEEVNSYWKTMPWWGL